MTNPKSVLDRDPREKKRFFGQRVRITGLIAGEKVYRDIKECAAGMVGKIMKLSDVTDQLQKVRSDIDVYAADACTCGLPDCPERTISTIGYTTRFHTQAVVESLDRLSCVMQDVLSYELAE